MILSIPSMSFRLISQPPSSVRILRASTITLLPTKIYTFSHLYKSKVKPVVAAASSDHHHRHEDDDSWKDEEIEKFVSNTNPLMLKFIAMKQDVGSATFATDLVQASKKYLPPSVLESDEGWLTLIFESTLVNMLNLELNLALIDLIYQKKPLDMADEDFIKMLNENMKETEAYYSPAIVNWVKKHRMTLFKKKPSHMAVEDFIQILNEKEGSRPPYHSPAIFHWVKNHGMILFKNPFFSEVIVTRRNLECAMAAMAIVAKAKDESAENDPVYLELVAESKCFFKLGSELEVVEKQYWSYKNQQPRSEIEFDDRLYSIMMESATTYTLLSASIVTWMWTEANGKVIYIPTDTDAQLPTKTDDADADDADAK